MFLGELEWTERKGWRKDAIYLLKSEKVTLVVWLGCECNSITGEVEKLRGLRYVLGMFFFLCSQVFTSIFGMLSSDRWLFLWSRRSSLSRLVMNKCVAGEVRPGSLLNAPLSCCLLPCCPCQASTTPTPTHTLMRKPSFQADRGPWSMEGGGVRLQQRSASRCCP